MTGPIKWPYDMRRSSFHRAQQGHTLSVDFAHTMSSLRAFLTGIVDYAGLFPPASLPMQTVIANYAEYSTGPDCDLLGRLVVPTSRIDEFSEAASDYLPRTGASGPWRLSALVGDNPGTDAEAIAGFNRTHGASSNDGRAICDAIEAHARRPGDIEQLREIFPDSLRLFFEIAAESDPVPFLHEIAIHGGAAKIRTGGVTENAFPASSDVIRFIAACKEAGVSFKATAGLHHLLRSDYPLTYEASSSCATMYGYLNLFLAAAYIWKGMPEPGAERVLEEQSLESFEITDNGVSWQGNPLSLTDLHETRIRFALSFGSCSFREPVDEARALHLI